MDKQIYALAYLIDFVEVALELENIQTIEYFLQIVGNTCYNNFWYHLFMKTAENKQYDVLKFILQHAEGRDPLMQPYIRKHLLEVKDEKAIKLLLQSTLELDLGDVLREDEYEEVAKTTAQEIITIVLEFPECLSLFLQKLKEYNIELHEFGLALLQEDV